MDPPPPLIISGIAYFNPRNTPLRLMSMQRSQSSSGSSVSFPHVTMPALLKRTSSLPYLSTAVAIIL